MKSVFALFGAYNMLEPNDFGIFDAILSLHDSGSLQLWTFGFVRFLKFLTTLHVNWMHFRSL